MTTGEKEGCNDGRESAPNSTGGAHSLNQALDDLEAFR